MRAVQHAKLEGTTFQVILRWFKVHEWNLSHQRWGLQWGRGHHGDCDVFLKGMMLLIPMWFQHLLWFCDLMKIHLSFNSWYFQTQRNISKASSPHHVDPMFICFAKCSACVVLCMWNGQDHAEFLCNWLFPQCRPPDSIPFGVHYDPWEKNTWYGWLALGNVFLSILRSLCKRPILVGHKHNPPVRFTDVYWVL